MLIPALLLAFQGGGAAPAPATTATAKPAFGIALSKPMLGVRPISMASAPTGHQVALGLEDTTIRIVDAATRQTQKTLQGHKTTVQAIAWSPNGRWIASGDEKANVYIWDTKTWTRIHSIVAHTRPIQALDFNADSSQLLTTGQDDFVKIWDLKNLKKEKISLPGAGANFYGAKFIGKSNDFAMATLQQGARLYTAQKTMRGWLTGHGNMGSMYVDFNPAASLAVTAGRDNRASLYDVKKMARIGSLKGHEDWVMAAVFAPNGKWIATSSTDRTVRVWDVKSYAQVVLLPEQKAVGSPVLFTRDGRYLLTADIADNLVVHTLNPPQGPTQPAKAPAKGKGGKKRRGG